MKTKNLIILTVLSWLGIGVFYLMYLLKFEPVIVGVLRELLILPLYGFGLICPILLVIHLIRQRMRK